MQKLYLNRIFHNIFQENKIKLVMGQKIYQSLNYHKLLLGYEIGI